jgi:hypothetical protein
MEIDEARKQAAEARIVEQARRIDFFTTEYTVEILAAKMKDESYEVPPYQREDTWEPERKCRFIESLLMGLPIPFLFFWERPEDGKLEIVDGSQRLRTIKQFIYDELVLGELDVLPELEGMRFSDLLPSRQNKLKNRSVRGIVLNSAADDQARFEIFDRINTGSKIANKAEVRRGALIGPFLDLVIDLATNETFKELAPFPETNVKLRDREELVTRFFAYSDGLDSYHDRPSDFLFAYAKEMNKQMAADPAKVEAYRRRFIDTMQFVAKAFPHGFRRTPNGTTTPKTRFEAIAIGSFMAMRESPSIAERPHSVSTWVFADDFKDVVGADGSNAIGRLLRVR